MEQSCAFFLRNYRSFRIQYNWKIIKTIYFDLRDDWLRDEAGVWWNEVAMWWMMALVAAGLYEDGLRLIAQGRWVEARQVLQRAVEGEPRQARAWKALGVAAGQTGDIVGAEEAFQKGCEIEPRLEDVCYYHARSLYTLNRFEGAIRAFEGLRKTEARKGRLLTALGQAYEANGQAGQAEEAFQQALQQGDYPGEARLRYGVFLFRAGRLDEAEKLVREAVKRSEGSPEAEAELGRILYQQGKLSEAIAWLERGAAQFEWAQLLRDKAKRRLEAKEQP